MSKRKATTTKAPAAKPVTEAEVTPEAVTEAPAAVTEAPAAVTEAEVTPEAVTEAPAAVSAPEVLSQRACEYLRVLLAQYFGHKDTEENMPKWIAAINSCKQLLVLNHPMRGEITDAAFDADDPSRDVKGPNVLLNVQRQLVNVRLL